MDASLWVAKTGLDAQNTRLNVISNNLANVNTTGFKRDRANFEDLLYQNVRQAGGQTALTTQSPTGLMLGTGTRVISTEKLHSQGNMINTQNALDIAVNGEGFFQIVQQDGTIAYTRDGSFKLSNTGQLVTPTGVITESASGISRAFVFCLDEPDRAPAFRAANDRTLAYAARSQGRVIPFCRLDLSGDAEAEASLVNSRLRLSMTAPEPSAAMILRIRPSSSRAELWVLKKFLVPSL